MDNERDLLLRALEISRTIEQCPVEKLASFKNELQTLLNTYHSITHKVKNEKICPESDSMGHRAADVHGLLTAAIETIPDIKAAAWKFHSPEIEACKDPIRAMHIQNILTLQKRKTPIRSDSPERILAICASRSLAQDFYDFEMKGGWKPKEDQLIERILRGQDVAIQTISKNQKNYVAANAFPQTTARAKLDAAIRFGIKLGVVEAIGRTVGIYSLSLLLGFECVRFTRTSFLTLGHLQEALKDNRLCHELKSFAGLMDAWWWNCQESYCTQFRAIEIPKAHNITEVTCVDGATPSSSLYSPVSSDGPPDPAPYSAADKSPGALRRSLNDHISSDSHHITFDSTWDVDILSTAKDSVGYGWGIEQSYMT